MGTLHAAGVSAIHTIMLTAHMENTDAALGYRNSSVTYSTDRMNIKLNNKQAFPIQFIFTSAVSGAIKKIFPSKVGLNPNTILHPSDVSGGSTFILQVSKYAKVLLTS